jgi:hypothetical protein
MADNTMIKVVFAGAAGYLAYRMGWLSSLGLTPAPASAATGTTGTTAAGSGATAPTTTASGKPSLATIQAQLLAAAKAPAAGLSVDDWGFFLNQVLAPFGMTAPDPAPIFSAAWANIYATLSAISKAAGTTLPDGWSSTWNRATLYNAADYWAAMAPALTAQRGLTGLGTFGCVSCYRGAY